MMPSSESKTKKLYVEVYVAEQKEVVRIAPIVYDPSKSIDLQNLMRHPKTQKKLDWLNLHLVRI